MLLKKIFAFFFPFFPQKKEEKKEKKEVIAKKPLPWWTEISINEAMQIASQGKLLHECVVRKLTSHPQNHARVEEVTVKVKRGLYSSGGNLFLLEEIIPEYIPEYEGLRSPQRIFNIAIKIGRETSERTLKLNLSLNSEELLAIAKYRSLPS